MKNKKHKLKFPPKILKLHVPFRPLFKVLGQGVYEEMYQELEKYQEPKGTKIIKISSEIWINKKTPELSFATSEIIFER